ncbi:helix-turn-helix transcriptional regulator [Leisingera sp. JC11]|uniref:helix-turn-helix domain-containing protein n=1 Tax=Leisingera sp. JC11 TaxID=3042469 RepID=UPI0034550EF7
MFVPSSYPTQSGWFDSIHPHFGSKPITRVAGLVELQGRTILAGSVHSDAYRDFLRALVALRKSRGLSQAELAKLLSKPPSFVGKYELGERRLDVVELMVILQVLESEFEPFWNGADISLPSRL